MRTRIGLLCLALAFVSAVASAQARRNLTTADIYCAGMVTTDSATTGTYVISGEESNLRIGWEEGELVYVNKGSSQGARVGDRFLVSRPVKDSWRWKWFESQPWLQRAMGQQWTDVGQLQVVVVHPNVSIAKVTFSCLPVNRGDVVRTYSERPAPPLKTSKFDPFAPVSGRATAMLVSSKNFESAMLGTNDVAYVNLGSGQGVKIGDYFRVYRYHGTRHETTYQLRGTAYSLYGFGKTPRRYSWDELPREVLGEGIVLNVSPNSSTVLITHSNRELYLGDYVELQHPEPIAEAPPPPPPPANRAPTMTCSADRGSVTAGERVRISARASDPDGDNLRYAWRASAGQVVGSGAAVQLDTTGLAPGRYTVTGRTEDGRTGAADCTVALNVEAPPAPAQASKMNECLFRGSSARVDNVCKRILDDASIQLKNDTRARVVLIGFADPGEANADRLAGQRAANAKEYLQSTGIASVRVDTRTATGQAGAGAQNRRVDIIWVPAGADY